MRRIGLQHGVEKRPFVSEEWVGRNRRWQLLETFFEKSETVEGIVLKIKVTSPLSAAAENSFTLTSSIGRDISPPLLEIQGHESYDRSHEKWQPPFLIGSNYSWRRNQILAAINLHELFPLPFNSCGMIAAASKYKRSLRYIRCIEEAAAAAAAAVSPHQAANWWNYSLQ